MDTPVTASGRLPAVPPPGRWPHVCLGIFSTGPKALCVVPNKVFQGAAAGCAVVTADTPPQRRALGDSAVLVPPGDPELLAEALLRLASHPDELAELRGRARRLADARFAPGQVVTPLLRSLGADPGRAGAEMNPARR